MPSSKRMKYSNVEKRYSFLFKLRDKIYELKPGQSPLAYIENLDNIYLASLKK